MLTSYGNYSIFFMLFSGVYGAIFASFFCVVYERYGTGLTILGRSKCACGRDLKISENIPIIGFLKCKGKATCCGAKIPLWYFYSEVSAFVIWFSLGFFGFVGMAAALLISLLFLLIMIIAKKPKNKNT